MIRLLADDLLRLFPLAEAGLERGDEAAALLNEELSRGDITTTGDPMLVGMGSTVEFEDEVSGERRVVVLVYPGDADVATGRISVLTPVGATLIGLSVGQTMAWRTRGGMEKRLRVLQVEQPAPGERLPQWRRWTDRPS
jgi:regulator of nucleoside diphosphate kinase